eukprot:scaffold19989_cov112-Isochrysis_galbana.AAC.8
MHGVCTIVPDTKQKGTARAPPGCRTPPGPVADARPMLMHVRYVYGVRSTHTAHRDDLSTHGADAR